MILLSRVPNIGTRYNKMGIIMSTSIILLDKNFNTNDTDKKFGGNRCHGPNFYNGGGGRDVQMCKWESYYQKPAKDGKKSKNK